MNVIFFVIIDTAVMMIPICFITYTIVQKKIAKSNDVGTKVNLVEFLTDQSDSKFYCDTDVDPGIIIADRGSNPARDREDTEDDRE